MNSYPRMSKNILKRMKYPLNPRCFHISAPFRAVPLAHNIFEKSKHPNLGPPLILIHGLFGSKRNWESLAKAFSRKRKVIVVDCRNHGDSPWVPDMSYDLMAEDVELLMNDLTIGKAIVLGHSMGGKVAMSLALNKPDLVSKLIIEDVSPEPFRPEEAWAYIGSIIKAMQYVNFNNALSLPAMRRSVGQQLTNTVPAKDIRNFILTNLIQKDDGYAWQVNLDSIDKNLNELMAFPDTNLSHTGKTLFIGGSESDLIRPKHLPLISRFFPNSKVHHILGSGHWVHADKPREFIEVVEDFINNE